MTEDATIQSQSEILFKRIEIAMLAKKRAHKLYMMADWRRRNPNAKLIWDENNKAHVKNYEAEYRALPETVTRKQLNRRLWRLKNMPKVRALKQAWKTNNPDKFRAMTRKAEITGITKHPHMAMRSRLKANIRMCLKNSGGSKANRTSENIIGCDMRFFVKWITSLFLPGMTFENRNLWQLDHIFPIACCGKNQQQILHAQHYRNLRPLWKTENRDKWCLLTDDSLIAGFLCGLSEIHLTHQNQATGDILDKAKRIGFSVFDHVV